MTFSQTALRSLPAFVGFVVIQVITWSQPTLVGSRLLPTRPETNGSAGGEPYLNNGGEPVR